MNRRLLGLVALLAGVIALSSPRTGSAENVTNEFTYQGQLKSGVNVYTGTCSFEVSLWDSDDNVTGSLGLQQLNGVVVTGGLFTLTLNGASQFGANPFDGNARWLALKVKCGADAGFTSLGPRQPLTGAPYALGLRLPASESVNSSQTALAIVNQGTGVGFASSSVGGWGIGASSGSNTGLQAHSNTFYGVYADSGSGVGVAGVSGGGNAGVYGSSASGIGVNGVVSNANPAVNGSNSESGPGVSGDSKTGYGVYGSSPNGGAGVYGIGGTGGIGVLGAATGSGDGVHGNNTDPAGYAGFFNGRVRVQGNLHSTSNVSTERATDGTVKAGVFASCAGAASNIIRSFNNTSTSTITISNPGADGACVIDFGFTINDRYMVVTAFGGDAPSAAVFGYLTATSVQVNAFNHGVLANRNISVLIY